VFYNTKAGGGTCCHWLFFIGKVYNIMAQFCINIPDDKLNEVLTAMGAQYRYQATVDNPNFDPELPEDPDTNPSTITNPENLAQFVNRMTRQWIIENVKAHNSKQAAAAAKQAALDAVSIDITDPQLP
jgi:hypothetical protein